MILAVEGLLIARGHVLAGQLADAALLLLLLNGAVVLRGDSQTAQAGRAAMHSLALVPLIRVVGAGLPLRDLSRPTEELLVALPIGAAALFLAPVVGVPRGMFLAVRQSRPQIVAVACGLGLGLVAYLLGASALWPSGAAGDRVAFAVGVAAAGAAVQEIVFRGLVQTSLQRVAGRAGLAAATLLFAAIHLDAGSTALVMTSALAGTVFAATVARTGALGGAIAGHALFAIGSGALWPALLGRDAPTWLDGSLAPVLLAGALVVAAAATLRVPLPGPATGADERERAEIPGEAPPPPARPRRAPAQAGGRATAAPRARMRVDRRTQVTALACVLITALGVAGFFVGRVSTPESDGTTITRGRLAVTVPSGWERRPPEKEPPDVTTTDALAGGPRKDERSGIVAWRALRPDATFLPAGLRLADRRPPELIHLGAYDAYRRRGVGAGPDRMRVTIYSIPAVEGVAVIACHAPRPKAKRFMPECESAATSIVIDGLGAARRGTVLKDQNRLRAVMSRLGRRRSAARRRLSAARSRPEQAAATRELRAAYRSTRIALERLRTGPATRAQQRRLVGAVARVERGYGLLARAVQGRSATSYDSARSMIGRSESALRRLLESGPAPR